MDDGFIALPENINSEIFKNALNELLPAIEFTMEEGKSISEHEESLHFLDIEIILTKGKEIHTDIYYKDTNPHDYLNFHSAHPTHIKNTIPFNLAKRVIVFVTKEDRLKEVKNWSLKCNYPNDLIDQAFHKSKITGPGTKSRKQHYPSRKYLLPKLKLRTRHENNCKPVQNHQRPRHERKIQRHQSSAALKQPPNLTSLLTKATFTSTADPRQPDIQDPGIFLCNKTR